jgi:hypothetical protein
MTFVLAAAAAFAAGIVYSSFFEWLLHRNLMHRPLLGFRYPYRTHALTHHRVFEWDESYHLLREEDAGTVTMAWWNAPALIAFNVPVVSGVSWAIFRLGSAGFWGASAGALLAMACYYATYETLHWCMHVPKERWIQRTRLFRFLDDHHRMHHKRPNRNLNVVFPLADWILRTKAPGLRPVFRIADEARAASVS